MAISRPLTLYSDVTTVYEIIIVLLPHSVFFGILNLFGWITHGILVAKSPYMTISRPLGRRVVTLGISAEFKARPGGYHVSLSGTMVISPGVRSEFKTRTDGY